MLECEGRYHDRIVRIDVEKLKELRADRALSLRELAVVSGVSHTTIWKLEQGREDAHPRTIRLLAGALGIAPRELMAKASNDA
jgi:transcriptional regulator with XRE-family HTH domain